MIVRLTAFFSAAALLLAEAPLHVSVRFDKHLRDWDGFGINYVQVAQTRDYKADPQEYGGFRLLTEEQRHQVMEMIFGVDGLRPGVLKMFLDPYHEPVNDNDDPNSIDMAKFDHTTTTEWLRYFAREGLAKTRARGGDLQIITTLYGPPAWATKQKFVRGRDLDPTFKYEVAEYLISWAKYLRDTEKLPVKYLALHNEGEDFTRWPEDGNDAGKANHDFNMYWPPEQVVDFLRFMPAMLARQGMADVTVTPGETTNWVRFAEWGYADAIADDSAALKGLGLITSHGFVGFGRNRWFADWRSAGTDMLRAKRPELHAWVTSQSWSKMDAWMVHEMRNNIYVAKVNAIIPWAAVQRPAKWVGGDPNPGSAFSIDESGHLTVRPGYYYYKQIARAGQPGMAVARVACPDTEVGVMAFASNRTANPDAFVVYNLSGVAKPLEIAVAGSKAARFRAFRTSDSESYAALGPVTVENGVIRYPAPAASVTTFFGSN